jgi:hypothetical protein
MYRNRSGETTVKPSFILLSLALSMTSLFGETPPAHDVTPSAGPRVLGGWDTFITADFIYWTPRVGGLGSLLSGYTPTTPSIQGKVFNPHWKWDAGFKVGLGRNLPHDGWDTTLDFTWFESNARNRTQDPNLFPIWNIASQYNIPSALNEYAGNGIYASDMRWSFWMNWFDLELGRNCYLSPYFKLRPFGGLKTAFGMQKYAVQYTRQINFNNQAKDSMNNDFHYFGIGPRAGVNSSWQFSETWSLYGDFAGSLLWSQFLQHRKDTSETLAAIPIPRVVFLNINNHLNTCIPVLEFALGLRWETWFSDDDYHVLLQAGFEEQIWFNYNHILTTQKEASSGNLTTQGLTARFRFDF